MASKEREVFFSREEIGRHKSDGDLWVIHSGKVYDISKFSERHPGGKDVLLLNSGQDVTSIMSNGEIHKHSQIAYGWLKKYNIGRLQAEDLVDWSKPMLAQVGNLGPNYVKWVHSPVDRPLRLFESSFVEFFSRTPWYFVPIIWIPIVLYLAYLGFYHLKTDDLAFGESDGAALLVLLAFCGLFSLGLFIWSFVEYCLHRFLFHLLPPPDKPFWITFHFFLHGQHHKVPFDGDRLVFPPVAAAVFAFAFYSFFFAILPSGTAHSLFAGGLLGYVLYDCIHYYLHHGSPRKGGYFHNLKKYHVEHHFESQQQGFGISSQLWDFPFQTHPWKSKDS
ncbi:predicted protein [Nematostella vectensis]|uniref:Fatty acid 2-hydroxylase n=1 Tax=Nematostella vectensis TaxID=45351 RepID=A7RML3_NEMVE|nr:predicted protein [Nematostella vectensis]|eukprot:XP_001639353.1 predicted protein [Nematostella vectensis]